jgi:hypothetical protein
MDFKSLINKISSMDSPIETVAAPELPKSVQLNEDAQLRVLSGRTTYVAEVKKKAEDDETAEKKMKNSLDKDGDGKHTMADHKKEKTVKEEMKVGDSKKTAKGGTVTKTKTGIVHKAGPGSYGGSDDKDTDPDADDEPKAKKAKKESIEEASKAQSAARDKFMAMVKGKKDDKKDSKKDDKKEESVKEGKGKPDFLDMDKDGDKKEPMKKAVADKKKGAAPKKGVNPFAKKTESKMMPKGKKRPVKESIEGKLSFRDMVKLVQESGGQQQIDAVDTVLFQWANRVAVSKLGEGTKAELYAGLIYERNGGVFEMYDVLSEAQK